jgi:hypothetical protein
VLTPEQFNEEQTMEHENDKRHEAYQAYLQTQCSYWSPESEEYLAGEAVFQWACREHIRRAIVEQQKDLDKIDSVVAGLLYDMKQKLSKLGRSGGWSAWLKQNKISRSTADRLVLEHAEYFNISDELPRRQPAEPLEGNVCQAAFRTKKQLANTLRSPKSRMTFIKVLADIFGFDVEHGNSNAVRLTAPPTADPLPFDNRVPNLITIMEDGAVIPVDYELKDWR